MGKRVGIASGVGVGLALAIALVAVYLWSRHVPVEDGSARVERDPVAASSTATVVEARLSAQSAGESAAAAGAPRDSGRSAAEQATRILSTDRAQRWTEAIAILSGSDFGAWWRTLTDPAIAASPEAKRWREQVLLTCLGVLDFATTGMITNPDVARGGLSDAHIDACRPLLEVGTVDELREQFDALQSDSVLREAPFPRAGLSNLSAEERAIERVDLEQVLEQRRDPLAMEAAVRVLASEHPGALVDDAPTYDRLSARQKHVIGSAAGLWTACRAARNCGPDTYWTLYFCFRSHPGVMCARGAGLTEVIEQNLSPVELGFVRQMVARAESPRP